MVFFECEIIDCYGKKNKCRINSEEVIYFESRPNFSGRVFHLKNGNRIRTLTQFQNIKDSLVGSFFIVDYQENEKYAIKKEEVIYFEENNVSNTTFYLKNGHVLTINYGISDIK